MSTVGQFRQIRLKTGTRDRYLQLQMPLCRCVESEPGSLIYLLHTDKEQPDSVWLYARFRDATALAVHLRSSTYAEVASNCKDLIVSIDDLDVELVGNKGVPAEPPGLRSFAG